MPGKSAQTFAFTPNTISRVKPEEGRIVNCYDTQVPQLMLRVLPSGIRTFNVNWARNKRASLGTWPKVTIEQARTKAREMLAQAATEGEPEAVKVKRHMAERRTGERVETFGELVKNYISFIEHDHKAGSVKKTKHRLNTVFKDMHDRHLDRLDAMTIERWRRDRIKEGRAVATVERDLAALRAALAHAVRHGFLAAHPMREVKRRKFDNARVRFLSADEEKRLREVLAKRDATMRAKRASANEWRAGRSRELLPALPDNGFGDHITPLLLVALNTGLRRGELTSLLWTDVDLDKANLTVRAAAAKGGKRRDVPLNDEALDVLKRWKKQCKTIRVFEFADPKTAIARVLDKAKITDFSLHDCRHTFASKLVMAGVDLNTVRELLGHADLKMTLRYSHLAPKHKAAAVALLSSAAA
jgi:integrase